VWTDIAPIGAQARERLGYPTQKPLALLERIIKASSNPGDIVLDAFCGCGTTLVAARNLGRRFVGIDISPSSCNVMGGRLEQVCGLRQAPLSMGVEEIAASWDAGGRADGRAGVAARSSSGADPGGGEERSGGEDKSGQGRPPSAMPPSGEEMAGAAVRPTVAYYHFSNLPRNAEQLRALPGFEFENWAVLQLGEVLRHHGHSIFAQANRSKVGDLGLDGKIYLVTNTSLPVRTDLPLLAHSGQRGERQPYLPVQVKNKDKVGRPDIDSFAHALERDERAAGFFIGWEFTRDADKEIERLHTAREVKHVFPVRVQQLIEETFNLELLELMGR
jgi:hypothetical protein